MDATWGSFCDQAGAIKEALELSEKYKTPINIIRPGARSGVHYFDKPQSYVFATPEATPRSMERLELARVEWNIGKRR